MKQKNLTVTHQKSAEEAKKLAIKKAKAYTNPVFSTVLTINDIHNQCIDVCTLAEQLEKQVNDVLQGNTKILEKILITQAQTLNVIFHNMTARMASENCEEGIDLFSNIALRAQNQCQKTLTALGVLRHPPQTTVVQQQNLAVNQQVNSTMQIETSKSLVKSANELLGVNHEQVDAGKTIKPIQANFQVETMEKVYRCENSSR